MARRTRDGGVQERKSFSPPNGHTTSSSSTRLPIDSWDLNTRVPNTGAATPQRLRPYFVDARDAETRRAWQQQQANANAAAEAAALQAMHEKTTRLAGEHKGGCVTSNFYIEGIAVLCKKKEISLLCVSTCSGVLEAVCCFVVTHTVCFPSVSPACCTVC